MEAIEQNGFIAEVGRLLQSKYGKTERFANYAVAQMNLESTYGTSRLARENNNFGGLTQTEPNGEENRQTDGGTNYYRVFGTPEEYTDAIVNDFFNHYPAIYDAQSIEEYATILHDNGYFTAPLEDYIAGMYGASSEEWKNTNYYGGVNPLYVMQNAPVSPYGEDGYLDRNSDWQNISKGNVTELGGGLSSFADSFLDSWYNNGTVSVVRRALVADNNTVMGTPREDLSNLDDYTLKQALANLGLSESDYQSKTGRRYETFENIKSEAWDRNQLLALAKMKGEDLDREERIERRGTTVMGITGTVAGTLLDPLNFVPLIGQEALAVKLAGKAGGALASKLAGSQLAQLAEIGLTNGLINVGDQYIANKTGYWNNQNYALSFLLGTGAGAGLSFIQRRMRTRGNQPTPKGKYELEFEDEVNNTANKAIENLTGVKPKKPPVTEVKDIPPSTKEAPVVKPLSGLKPLDDDLLGEVIAVASKKTEPVRKGLVDTLNDRYGLKIKGEITGDTLLKYLHTEPDGTYLRPTKLVKLMDAYGLNTIEDMAKHAVAYNKHAKTDAIQEYFEGIVGGKLTGAQFLDVARHIKSGGTFNDLEIHLNDGSVFLNGVHHSPNSLVTKALNDDPIFADPEDIAKAMAKDEEFPDVFRNEKQGRAENNKGNIRKQETIDDEQQLSGNRIAKVSGRKLETSSWIGNRYGVFINSPSKTMNKIARTMGIDPRLRANNNQTVPPVSMIKQNLMNKYSKHQVDLMNAFKKWCIDTGNINVTNNVRRKFNEEVSRVYDSLYNPYNVENYVSDSPSINQAVKAVKAFRDLDLRLHKLNGTLPKDFQGAGELWRRIDYDKQGVLRTVFNNDEEFSSFMRTVAKESIQWEDITPAYRQEYLMNLDLSDVEAQAIMRSRGLEFKIGQVVEGHPYSFNTLDDMKNFIKNDLLVNDDEAFQNVVAGHWAEQVTRRQDDLMSDIHIGSDKMGYYQSRIPMDTNKLFKLPNGQVFTFNDSLRNQDLGSIMAYVAHRSSGAMALNRIGISNPVTDLRKIYERVEGELAEAVQNRTISSTQMTRELEELKDVFHNVSGGVLIFPEAVRPQDVPDMFKKILLTESYRQNGLNFGVNQVAEMVGGLSVVGSRALTHYVPALHDLIHKLKYSKDFSAEQLRHFKDYHLGHQLAEYIWFNPQLKRNAFGTQAEQQGVMMKALGGIESVVDFGAKFTSTINQITKMTHLSVSGIKADILPEMMMWARGEYNSFLRKKLFSDRHLAEAGITDPSAFKKILQERLLNLGDEKDALSKAMTKWQDEDMTSYMKLETFLDLSSQRAILQPSLWNNARKKTGWAGLVQGIMWQFKNFSQVALNNHLGRVLNNNERENFTLLMSTALSNGAVWATSVFFNSYKYFGDNEEKRQAYLDKTLTPERLIATGLMRSSVLSGLSFANDGYEMFAGGTSNRTTVDRMPESDNPYYNIITQFPAVQSAYRAFNGITSVPEAMANLMSNKEADYDPLMRLFPIDRYLPVKGILSITADQAELERERRKEIHKKREDRNKKKIEQRKERDGRQQNVQNESILDLLK
ncbi:glucosaminidase domain-containing protein [Veillonella intestinalis]|uniref:glucosaminidase domain-containing protein n=1 Tax=Veillonella intestinalis TaxID=2941341 RepID=UPI0020423533|nr:glucosaminidase domain-containing protein [Veillonella intestinalis]